MLDGDPSRYRLTRAISDEGLLRSCNMLTMPMRVFCRWSCAAAGPRPQPLAKRGTHGRGSIKQAGEARQMAVRVCCAAQRANMCRQQHECHCMQCAHDGPQQPGRGASTHAVDHFGFWYVPDACIAPSAQRPAS